MSSNFKLKSLNFSVTTPQEVWLEILDEPKAVITMHAEMTYLASKDQLYSDEIVRSNYLVPDGVGLLWGLSFLGKKVKKCSGVDIIGSPILENGDIPVYLWGSSDEVVKKTAEVLKKKGVNVVGFHDGYGGKKEDIFTEIKKTKAKVVFVGMGGTPKQLTLVNDLKKELALTAITVGGSFDVISGNVKRAPGLITKLGLEWLWRSISTPKRLSRLPYLLGFVILVIREKING